jgi:predicted transcriptional regulator
MKKIDIGFNTTTNNALGRLNTLGLIKREKDGTIGFNTVLL